MLRIYLAVAAILTAMMMYVGCGEDSAPTGTSNSNNDTTETFTDSILWTGAAVLYDTVVEKKGYSLVLFGAPWCSYCRKLDELTLTDPRVIGIMNESFNCVRINVDADSMVAYFDSMVTCRQFAINHDVSGIPTTCILNRKGNLLGKIIGYHPPTEYAGYLDNIRNGALGPP